MKDSENVDIIIKSYMRFEVVKELILSIRKYYPNNRIVIGDDSECFDANIEKEIKKMNVEIHKLTPHVGLSAGRNYLVNQVNTNYFLYLDDDHLIIDDMFIEKMINCSKRNSSTITSASVLDGPGNWWYGHFSLKNRILIRNFYITKLKEFQVRFCPNFFLGITKDFHDNNLKWDENLKLGEHDDFFLRVPSKLKIFHLKENLIKRSNKREYSDDYNKKRWDRMELFRKIVREKYGFKGDPKINKIKHNGGVPPTVPLRNCVL
jgi:hypothetical protein